MPVGVETAECTREFVREAEALGVDFRRQPVEWAAITGYSQETPLGGTDETFEGRIEGRSGIREVQVYPESQTRIAALMPDGYDPYKYLLQGGRNADGNMVYGDKRAGVSPIAAMNIGNARRAFSMAKLLSENGITVVEDANPSEVGHWIGSGMSSAGNIIRIHQGLELLAEIRGQEKPDPEKVKLINRLMSADTAMQIFPENAGGRVAMHLGYNGESGGTAEACATGLANVIEAYYSVKSGRTKVNLGGGSEFAPEEWLDETTATFNAVHALAQYYGYDSNIANGPYDPKKSGYFFEDPREVSRPFDSRRSGFVEGVGAGFLVLEGAKYAIQREAKIYALVLGVGKSMDGRNPDGKFRPTESNVFQVARTIAQALHNEEERATIVPDFAVCHATSTPRGDSNEALAYQKVFKDKLPHILMTAPKGNYGHLLGAAGSTALIEAVMILNRGIIPHLRNYQHQDPEIDFLNLVLNQPQRFSPRVGLVVSNGFHGHNTAMAVFLPTQELLNHIASSI